MTTTFQWPQLEIHDPIVGGALCVFPLPGNGARAGDYTLLSVAVEKGIATISEMSDAGSVPVIVINNKGKLPVFGIQGEEYVGAKQNRTFNTSFLAPHGETKIPVTCVEQGRWHRHGQHFSAGNYESVPLRAMKASLIGCARAAGSTSFDADQFEVWKSIKLTSALHGIDSPTMAFSDIYADGGVKARMDDIIKPIELPDTTRGVVVAIGGRIVAADIFETADVFAHVWPRLLASYALSAVGTKPSLSPSLEAAESFLSSINNLKWMATPSVGLGEDIRWQGKHSTASALLWEDRLLHGAAFAA